MFEYKHVRGDSNNNFQDLELLVCWVIYVLIYAIHSNLIANLGFFLP